MVEPLLPVVEFILALWNNLPYPFYAILSLYLILFFIGILFRLIYKIRS